MFVLECFEHCLLYLPLPDIVVHFLGFGTCTAMKQTFRIFSPVPSMVLRTSLAPKADWGFPPFFLHGVGVDLIHCAADKVSRCTPKQGFTTRTRSSESHRRPTWSKVSLFSVG